MSSNNNNDNNSNTSVMGTISNATKKGLSNAREMIHNATKSVEERENEKSIGNMIQDNVPDSTQDAGKHIGRMMDDGTEKARDAIGEVAEAGRKYSNEAKESVTKGVQDKTPESVEEMGKDIQKKVEECTGGIKDMTTKDIGEDGSQSKTLLEKIGDVTKKGLSEARGIIHDATKSKEEMEDGKTVGERFVDAIPNSAEDAGTRIGLAIDDGVEKAKDAARDRLYSEKEDGEEQGAVRDQGVLQMAGDATKAGLSKTREVVHDATKSVEEKEQAMIGKEKENKAEDVSQ